MSTTTSLNQVDLQAVGALVEKIQQDPEAARTTWASGAAHIRSHDRRKLPRPPKSCSESGSILRGHQGAIRTTGTGSRARSARRRTRDNSPPMAGPLFQHRGGRAT